MSLLRQRQQQPSGEQGEGAWPPGRAAGRRSCWAAAPSAAARPLSLHDTLSPGHSRGSGAGQLHCVRHQAVLGRQPALAQGAPVEGAAHGGPPGVHLRKHRPPDMAGVELGQGGVEAGGAGSVDAHNCRAAALWAQGWHCRRVMCRQRRSTSHMVPSELTRMHAACHAAGKVRCSAAQWTGQLHCRCALGMMSVLTSLTISGLLLSTAADCTKPSPLAAATWTRPPAAPAGGAAYGHSSDTGSKLT